MCLSTFVFLTVIKQMERLAFLFLIVFLSNGLSLASSNYTAIFSFGDSYTSVGVPANSMHYSPGAIPLVVNSPPYGMTFFGHPAGRNSDGRLIIDFIAEAFGVPLLPAFPSDAKNFRQGANFAVVGASALAADSIIPNFNISMDDQIGRFEKLKPSLCKTDQECRDYFSKTLFVLGEIGVNDINFALLNSSFSFDGIRSNVPKVVKAICLATVRLIKQGAVNILVPGVPPIGCLPFQLFMEGNSGNKEEYDPRTGCLRKLNGLAEYHNRLLRMALLQLQKKYKNKRIAYGDFFGAVMPMVHSPQHFGFSGDVLKACCGKRGQYNFDFSAFCGQSGSTTCQDPSTHLIWDGSHYTDAANKYIATFMLKGL